MEPIDVARLQQALCERWGAHLGDGERLEGRLEEGLDGAAVATLAVISAAGDDRWEFVCEALRGAVGSLAARDQALDLADEALGLWLTGGRPRLTGRSTTPPRGQGRARLTATHHKPLLDAAADAWLRHGGRPPDDA